MVHAYNLDFLSNGKHSNLFNSSIHQVDHRICKLGGRWLLHRCVSLRRDSTCEDIVFLLSDLGIVQHRAYGDEDKADPRNSYLLQSTEIQHAQISQIPKGSTHQLPHGRLNKALQPIFNVRGEHSPSLLAWVCLLHDRPGSRLVLSSWLGSYFDDLCCERAVHEVLAKGEQVEDEIERQENGDHKWDI